MIVKFYDNIFEHIRALPRGRLMPMNRETERCA
jgi:hypothetical protein